MADFRIPGVGRRWTPLAFAAAALTTALLVGGPWLIAWRSVADPTPEQRMGYLDQALAASPVAAGDARGRMVLLGRGDIRHVGASRCARDYVCVRRTSGKGPCNAYSVTFYCAYEVTDRTGGGATAVLAVYPPAYRPGGNALPFGLAEEKLCELGYGCGPRARGQ